MQYYIMVSEKEVEKLIKSKIRKFSVYKEFEKALRENNKRKARKLFFNLLYYISLEELSKDLDKELLKLQTQSYIK